MLEFSLKQGFPIEVAIPPIEKKYSAFPLTLNPLPTPFVIRVELSKKNTARIDSHVDDTDRDFIIAYKWICRISTRILMLDPGDSDPATPIPNLPNKLGSLIHS